MIAQAQPSRRHSKFTPSTRFLGVEQDFEFFGRHSTFGDADNLVGVSERYSGESVLPLPNQGLAGAWIQLGAEVGLAEPLPGPPFGEVHGSRLVKSVASYFNQPESEREMMFTAVGGAERDRDGLHESMPTNPKRQPRRALTAEERADAARLKAIWQAYKRENRGATQQWLGEATGIGDQRAVEQYLNARIPLGPRSLARFAAVLGVAPEKISPRVASEALELKREIDEARGVVMKATGFSGALAAMRPEGEPVTQEQAPSLAPAGLPATMRVSLLPPLLSGGAPFPVCLDDLGPVASRAHALAALRMPEGDTSMVGTIHPGDALLVDTQDLALAEHAVYVVRLRGQLLVRRVVFGTAGAMVLVGDNPAVLPVGVMSGDMDALEILGRVVLRAGSANLC